MKNEKYFLRALELAESAKGLTSPNPSVGCIIIKEGKIIGEGNTGKSGSDHAEISALKMAGDAARGSDLYVTMEPCIEFPGKKTPSCAESIKRAGIRKVYISMQDPNPEISGKGISHLRNSGIEVKFSSAYKKRIEVLNEDYSKYITTGLPWVYLKCAMTLDGNIADRNGNSKWISCFESRRYVHMMRNRVDAVLVGIGTVLQDNPELTVRMVGKMKDPLRIVIDPDGRTPDSSHVLNDEGKTLFILGKGSGKGFMEKCLHFHKEYAEFELLDPDEKGRGRIDLRDLMKFLGREKGIESVMIEGGSRIYYNALKDGIIDKIMLFIAPKVLGGNGMPFFNGFNDLPVNEALNVKDFSTENIGMDILVQGYL